MLFYILTRLLADGLYNSIATGAVMFSTALLCKYTTNGEQKTEDAIMGQLYHKQNGGYDE